MDLTTYGLVVAAFSEKVKAEEVLTSDMCVEALGAREDLAEALKKIQKQFFDEASKTSSPTVKEVLQWLLSPEQVTLKRTASLKKQRTNEFEETEEEALVVRTAAGSVLMTLARTDVNQTVGELRKKVADQLSRCVEEVKFVVENKPLLDDASCSELVEGRSESLEVLMITQQIPSLDPALPMVDQLDTLKAMIMSSSGEYQLDAVTQYRKMLSIEQNPPIAKVLESGVAPRFLELAQCFETPKLQFEALWAICNIVSGDQEQTQAMVNLDVVPIVTRIIKESTNNDVLEQGIWTLGNVAGDSAPKRDACLQAGALLAILPILEKNYERKISCTRNAVWAISNLCRGRPKPDMKNLRPALPVIANVLKSDDQEVLTDALWCLSYISDGTSDDIQEALNLMISDRLVELMGHTAPAVITPTLRTAANLVTGSDEQTDQFLASKPWEALKMLLSHTKSKIRQESSWMISNICAGTTAQIQQVFDTGVFHAMLPLIRDQQMAVRKEVAFAMANTTEHEEVIPQLLTKEILTSVRVLMDTVDDKILQICLTFLENVLNYLDKLDDEKPWELIHEVGFADAVETAALRPTMVGTKASELLCRFADKDEETVKSEGIFSGGYSSTADTPGVPK